MLENDVKIIPTGCCHDCGGRCVLKAHLKDGKIIHIETDNTERPQYRACLRGRAYRQRVYSPDRLKYPLRRKGERGEGKFERISWDEALDSVATEMVKIKKKYGNSAIFLGSGGGNQGMLHNADVIARMLVNFGGFTRTWGVPSHEGALFASMATYGTMHTGNSREDLFNSKLIILWGWNPAVTVHDTGTSFFLAQAKEKGIKIVAVDPRYTDTAATFAGQWIPIRPGTDVAMLIAMAYVIVSENRHNRAFIERYTTGFDKYHDYLFGVEDGIAKTPQWAESITSVPAEIIINLAREYATTHPAALISGWGPARSAMGEQYSRAANMLPVITGNIGIPGGSAAGFLRAYTSRQRMMPGGPSNPVERGASPRRDSLYKLRGGTNPTSARIHSSKVYDAILRGRAGGYPADIKMAYFAYCNFLNQHPNLRRGIEALKSLEFILVHEQFMTPTAKFADIVLPINTFMERNDIAAPWLGSPYYIYLNQIIESLYESKSDLEICRQLSKRLGITPLFGDSTEDDLLRARANSRYDIVDYESLKRDGVLKIRLPEPVVSFKRHIEDPENNPFPTLSHKIEIYSEHIAEMEDPLSPPIPEYISHWEGYDDPLIEKYPLQLITTHHKARAHSTWDNVPWARETEPHSAWVNTVDAEVRNINDGDLVDVHNERGRIRLPAKVTGRIMPGVVDVSEGAWYNPDENGVDLGGCANVLTNDEQSPGGAVPMNTALVQIELSSIDQRSPEEAG